MKRRTVGLSGWGSGSPNIHCNHQSVLRPLSPGEDLKSPMNDLQRQTTGTHVRASVFVADLAVFALESAPAEVAPHSLQGYS